MTEIEPGRRAAWNNRKVAAGTRRGTPAERRFPSILTPPSCKSPISIKFQFEAGFVLFLLWENVFKDHRVIYWGFFLNIL